MKNAKDKTRDLRAESVRETENPAPSLVSHVLFFLVVVVAAYFVGVAAQSRFEQGIQRRPCCTV